MRVFCRKRGLTDQFQNSDAVFLPISVKFLFAWLKENNSRIILFQRIKNIEADILLNLEIQRILGNLAIQKFVQKHTFKRNKVYVWVLLLYLCDHGLA